MFHHQDTKDTKDTKKDHFENAIAGAAPRMCLTASSSVPFFL